MAEATKKYNNLAVSLFANNMQNRKEKSPDMFVKYLVEKKDVAKDGKNHWDIIGSAWKSKSGEGFQIQLDLDKIALYSK